jgi:nifR3 family TIM-barrel protein
MVHAAQIIEKVNPDILDINYGCPVKKVACKGAGAGLLQDIPKMVKLTEAVVKAVNIPVTVKTRLGWDDQTKNIVETAERLQDIGIEALTIHGRTRKQMYKGEADWTLIGAVKDNQRMKIPIFGNGDIDTPEKALLYKNRYGVDGIMIGRASIGNPWIFNEMKAFLKEGKRLERPTLKDRVEAATEHLDFSVQWKGERLGIVEMRRHYTNYFRALPHFKEYRQTLVTSMDLTEIKQVLTSIQEEYTFV